MKQKVKADLAILGAGAAGMMAALCASKRGLRVAVFDPHYSKPNNLAISGGIFPNAGSYLQVQAGVVDSPERWLDDLRTFAPDSINERIAASVANQMPLVLNFLIDECNASIRFLDEIPAPGHSARRFHSLQNSSGHALHAWLRNQVEAQKSIVLFPDQGVALIVRDGRGYDLYIEGGERQLSATHLLLAGGGFGGSPSMVAEFIPEMTGAIHSGSATNDGSVIALARSWGAALAGMNGYQGQGHTNPNGRTRLGMSLPMLGAVMLNREARRFVREDIGPSGLAAHVLAQPEQVALEIFDAEIEQQLTQHSAYAEARAQGCIIQAGSLNELAASAGVPQAQLQVTMREAEDYASARSIDPLGRRTFAKLLQPPYRASWVTGSLAHTQGGLVTDGSGQVLNESGQVIERLFAAGGSAAGLSGGGGDGYLPGNGLSQSFGLAYAAIAAIAGG